MIFLQFLIGLFFAGGAAAGLGSSRSNNASLDHVPTIPVAPTTGQETLPHPVDENQTDPVTNTVQTDNSNQDQPSNQTGDGTGQMDDSMDMANQTDGGTTAPSNQTGGGTGQMDDAMDMANQTDGGTTAPTDQTSGGTGQMDGAMDMADHTPLPLPHTAAEIEAYVHAVVTADEIHVHDMSSTKMPDHMAVLNLVPRDEATHIAIGNGSWFDPGNWYDGQIPGDGAKVLIPEGVTLSYDHLSDARLFTVRVDGELDFATDTSSKMVVDTFVVTPSGKMTAGTVGDPVQDNVQVDIIIANNGPIDTDWDPTLVSRGLISHGEVEMHGEVKDSHDKVVENPMEGDTWVQFGALPEGWEVGDKIVIAGTHYDGYKWNNDVKAPTYNEPEDEVRTISHIDGSMVFFDDPLIHDHDTPREDLHTSVANYTRNISIATENPDTAEIYERGHVMFMHSDDIDVRYVEFDELGRTDKSELSLSADQFDEINYDSNVKARYAFHLHRIGAEPGENQAIVVGNAVYGSPGWGFVQHDSNAFMSNNASYDTFGAGFVAESGNEDGIWSDNIAIDAQGVEWNNPKNTVHLAQFDTGNTGDGFWFQSRLIEATDNIAASVDHGFVYFQRGPMADNAQLTFDAGSYAFPDALHYADKLHPDDASIMEFSGNEVFASASGLAIVKSNPDQGHDVHSVLEDFTAWNVKSGAHLEYTSHYVLKDFDLIANEPEQFNNPGAGISYGTNTSDIVVNGAEIDGFTYGIALHKNFSTSAGDASPADHEFIVVDANMTNVEQDYYNYDPALDTILSSDDITIIKPTLSLDGPLTFKEGHGDPDARMVRIEGSKTDSLGTTDFPNGTDNFNLDASDVSNILEHSGYYTADDGNNYFTLDMYFSDRLSGDLYKQTELVKVDPNVPLGDPKSGLYGAAHFNGAIPLDDLQALADHDPIFVPRVQDNAPIHSQAEDAALWDLLTNHGENVIPEHDPVAMDAMEPDPIVDDLQLLGL